MPNDIKWYDDHIEVKPPKKPKKITGTRFGAILGMNPWSTPFKAWCEITRTYEEPFEDTIYTVAGKVIEPKQADYMEKAYLYEIIRPTDVYGEDPFKATHGDFYKSNPIFGGMWDYLQVEDGKVIGVFEMKTSKRVEDWQEDPPEYYALQAALYAYLSNVDTVIMVASFLDENDYEHPENYVPNAGNTILCEFKVSEKYPNFERLVEMGRRFWEDHVLTGISPKITKADKGIVEKLKTIKAEEPEEDVRMMLEEAEMLKTELDETAAFLKEKNDRLKNLTTQIRNYLKKCLTDDTNRITLDGQKYSFSLVKSPSEKVDVDRMKQDGIYEKYVDISDGYRMTVTERKSK